MSTQCGKLGQCSTIDAQHNLCLVLVFTQVMKNGGKKDTMATTLFHSAWHNIGKCLALTLTVVTVAALLSSIYTDFKQARPRTGKTITQLYFCA